MDKELREVERRDPDRAAMMRGRLVPREAVVLWQTGTKDYDFLRNEFILGVMIQCRGCKCYGIFTQKFKVHEMCLPWIDVVTRFQQCALREASKWQREHAHLVRA